MTDYAIFPAHQAVEAIRSSGYRDTPYALFELIDNSVEAEASEIRLAVVAGSGTGVQQIAVLDNGGGMDEHTLRQGLQYGNGTRLALPPRQRKLGRFGVGLPASTFSQCRRLDAYSWQNGVTNALCVRVDLDNVRNEQIHIVPEPERRRLPDDILRLFPDAEDYISGTLIVWGKVDRNSPKRPSTIVDKTARLAGRVYRNFLSDGRVKIRLLAVQDNQQVSKDVHPVDPLFLLPNPDMPEPFDKEPMFQAFKDMCNEDGSPAPIIIKGRSSDGELLGEVKIYAAHRNPRVLEVAREMNVRDPGSTKFGKFARDLAGVSIVRAGREIMLDRNWLSAETIDRWMGVTVEFDPVLDEHFGITNNKQDARRLADFAKRETADSDENIVVAEVAKEVHRLLSEMRKLIKAERRGKRGTGEKTDGDRELQNVTTAIQTRVPDHGIPNDQVDPDKEVITEMLQSTDAPPERPVEIVERHLRVEIATGNLGATEIFRPEARGGIMLVTLNRQHPMFDALHRALQPDDDESMEARLHDAEWVLYRLLISYSRAEVETEASPRDKQEFEDVRHRWGRLARHIFEHDK